MGLSSNKGEREEEEEKEGIYASQHKVAHERYLQSDSVAGQIEACAAFKLPIIKHIGKESKQHRAVSHLIILSNSFNLFQNPFKMLLRYMLNESLKHSLQLIIIYL